MTGETNLRKLLQTLHPVLNEGEYVFCCLPEMTEPAAEDAVMWFRESEGITLIVPRETADKNGWPYSFVVVWITLTVHSSLEAVGLTAAFSSALVTEGISCNVVAGYYHDHLFVSVKDAQRAMMVLNTISG